MPSIAVGYFDGRSSRRREAHLSAQEGRLCLEGAFGRRSEPLASVDISEPMDKAPRTLRFADGAYCEVVDQAGLAALLAAAGHRDSVVARAQRRWRWALPSVVAVVALVATTYLWVLPWAAAVAAPHVPEAITRAISAQALNSLDAHLLAPSKLPPEHQQRIAARLSEWGATLATLQRPLPVYRLHFRSAPRLGPNAFALPSGDLVVFDDLVALAKNDDDVVAVIAHELGHVRYHHGLRQLIQGAVVSSAVSIWLGDISSLAAGLGTLVLESRYSRAFEEEADAYAGHMLLVSGRSVTPLIQMLQRLETQHETMGEKSGSGEGRAFDSHPLTAERIAKLRSMGGDDSRQTR